MNEKKIKGSLQKKLILGLIIMTFFLESVITSVVVFQYRNKMEEYYSKIAFDEATIASHRIDGEKIKEYYETGKKDEYYEQIRQYLLDIKQTVGLQYFYVVVPEEEAMVYIWDAGEDGEDGVCDLLDEDAYYGGGYELMHNAFSMDAKNQILVTDNDEYGYLASAYVAIPDSKGEPVALASVDISMDMINDNIRTFVISVFFVSCLVVVVLVIIYYFYINHLIIKPVKILHKASTKLVKEDMNDLDQFSLDIHSKDEFEQLANAFQYMTKELSDYIQNLTEVTAEKERIGAELDVATHIQSSMLPCIFPAFPDRDEFDIYATMNPAKEVGGDFYDFFMVDERHLAIVVADVSGKGVPAALFMVIGKTLIKDHTEPGRDLGEVFSEVNDILCDSNSEGMFITAFEGVLDLVTGEFRYVNAGHEIPFICKAGETYAPYKIRAGFVLAGMEGMRYKCGSIQLEPGDKIYQYTDGVTEATNKENELYGMQRLEAVLGKNSEKSPTDLLAVVKADIDEFVGEAPQFDDITMLSLVYKKRMEDGKDEGINY